MNHFFSVVVYLLPLWVLAHFSILPALGQPQDFEGSFSQGSYPAQFLPGWYANEFRSTSSRIFRMSSGGIEGSVALAVQPISTFTGRIWIRLVPKGLSNPRVVFWAKSIKNGQGNRPALVHASWSTTLDGTYQGRDLIGSESQFSNANQEFEQVTLLVPPEIAQEEEVFLSLEIGVGAGTGTAARWVMDEFTLEEWVVDLVVPEVVEVKGFGAREVMVTFSEAVDPVFSQLALSYELAGTAVPLGVQRLADSVVVLAFEEILIENQGYTLFVQQVADQQGNFLKDTLFHWNFTDPTEFVYKSLVINELMPAPRQEQDLPFVEYLELMNPLGKELRLDGLLLATATAKTALPTYWLAPGELVLLAPAAQASLLESFGKVLPITNWPILSNSGTTIQIIAPSGQLVDQLKYTTSTWGGSELAATGVSLELPNPYYQCEGSVLLRPAVDPSKGTPGRQNSIFEPLQNKDLQVVQSRFRNESQVTISLNQAVQSWRGSESFSFTPELLIDSSWVSTNGETLEFTTLDPAQGSTWYTLKGGGLESCEGFPAAIETTLLLGEKAALGELILNEVLVDPLAGDPKFVELHNTSTQKFLSLAGWSLATQASEGEEITQIRHFGEEGMLLGPQGYLALSVDPLRLQFSYPQSATGHFLEVKSLPSMPIGAGAVLLVSPEQEVVEALYYREDWHHPLLRSSKGVSLERIAPNAPIGLESSWHSASSTSGYATPGKLNSTFLGAHLGEELIQVTPKVFDPEGSWGPDFCTISYQLDKGGWVGSFTIYSVNGREVVVLGQNQILGTSGAYSWTGTDAAGRRVLPGNYVLVVQLFDLMGRVKVIKKMVVVATRL